MLTRLFDDLLKLEHHPCMLGVPKLVLRKFGTKNHKVQEYLKLAAKLRLIDLIVARAVSLRMTLTLSGASRPSVWGGS